MLFCITLQTMAQTDGDNPEDREVDMDTPTFEPMVKVGKVLLDHDSVQYVQVNNVYVYPQPVFKNAEGEWEVASKPDWCEVSPASGNKKTEVTLTIKGMAKLQVDKPQ